MICIETIIMKTKHWQIGVLCYILYSGFLLFSINLAYKASRGLGNYSLILYISTPIFCLLSFCLYNIFKKTDFPVFIAKISNKCYQAVSIISIILFCCFCVIFIFASKILQIIDGGIIFLNIGVLGLLIVFAALNWLIAMVMPNKNKFAEYQITLMPAILFSCIGANICFSTILTYPILNFKEYMLFFAPILIALFICLVILFFNRILNN